MANNSIKAVDRVERAVKSLFSTSQARSRRGSSKGAQVRKIRRTAPSSTLEDLHSALTERLSKTGLLTVGRVQILGLEKIQQRLGQHWEQAADKAHAIVQKVLNKRLAGTDVYLRLGDMAYVIAFGELRKEEAQVKCAAISDEIWQRLVGEQVPLEEIDVRTVVTDVDQGVAIEQTNVLDLLAGLLDRAEGVQVGAQSSTKARKRRGEPKAPVGGGDLTLEFACEKPSHAPASQPGAMDEDAMRLRGGSEGSARQDAEDVDPLSATQADAAQSIGAERLIAEYGIEFRYRPLWDARRKVLSTYVCTAVKNGPHGVPVTGHAMLDSDEDTAITELDLLVLSRVWQDLVKVDKQGLRVLLACPVHYRTLVRGTSAERYRLLCQMVPEQLRRYVIFEIIGLQAGAPQSLIQDVSSSLWSCGRSIIAQLDWKQSSFESCRGSRLHAIGMDVDRCEGDEADIMAILERFAAGARESDLHSYVHGLSSLSLATAAVCAGFDYIDGDAVHDPVQLPHYVYRFKAEDLYTCLLGSNGAD